MNLRQLLMGVLCASTLTLLTACDNTQNTSSSDNDSVKPTESNAVSTNPVGRIRPEFSLKDLQGNVRNIKEWDGKVLVINFWATWCPPCRKEMPSFIELQEKYGNKGLQFIGVAIDTPQNVSDFSDTYGVNYPMLVGELEAVEIAKKYGNRFGALPYTVIVDRQGKMTFVQRGELLKDVAEKGITPLL